MAMSSDEGLRIEEKSVRELSTWMKENGIQDHFCEVFEANEIDGIAFCDLNENDLKAIVKPLGVVKKILRLQNSVMCSIGDDSDPLNETNTFSAEISPPLSHRPSCSSSLDSNSITSAASLISRREFCIPQKWKPSIMTAITNRQLYPEVRNEIVRDLVTHMYSHVEKPSISFVTKAAKMLVEKYPFMADSAESSPYGSWVKKIMDRVYNIEKGRKRKAMDSADEIPKKRGRPKRIINLESRYPKLQIPEGGTSEEHGHMEALSKEMEKENPRKEIVIQLMKSTFYCRRQFILHGEGSVWSKIDKFPALKVPHVIEQEIGLVLHKHGLQRSFNTEWNQKWVPAIIKYSRGLKRKDVKEIVTAVCDDDDDQKVALKLLYQLLCVQCKKTESCLDHLFVEYDMSAEPERVATSIPSRVTPWIGEFSVDDGESSYYVFVEQKVIFYVNTFTKALFLWFSLFYVFNLEYNKNTKELCLFFQEFVFGLPDNCCKKSSTYLSVTTDIQTLAQ